VNFSEAEIPFLFLLVWLTSWIVCEVEKKQMDIVTRTRIALAIMGVAIGLLAGLLATTVDFSALGINLWLILAIVTVFDVVILIVAHRRGKL
jgi:uncharacterized membrane protein